jgi:predicted  nucleic acid-binding Zn-ribbon protein
MEYQCKRCKHIWSKYRGGVPNNCPNCGIVCTWDTFQRPDYGERKRREWDEKQRAKTVEEILSERFRA